MAKRMILCCMAALLVSVGIDLQGQTYNHYPHLTVTKLKGNVSKVTKGKAVYHYDANKRLIYFKWARGHYFVEYQFDADGQVSQADVFHFSEKTCEMKPYCRFVFKYNGSKSECVIFNDNGREVMRHSPYNEYYPSPFNVGFDEVYLKLMAFSLQPKNMTEVERQEKEEYKERGEMQTRRILFDRDSKGKITYIHSESLNIFGRWEQDGLVTHTYKYNGKGQLVYHSDNGSVTTYDEYDSRGNLVRYDEDNRIYITYGDYSFDLGALKQSLMDSCRQELAKREREAFVKDSIRQAEEAKIARARFVRDSIEEVKRQHIADSVKAVKRAEQFKKEIAQRIEDIVDKVRTGKANVAGKIKSIEIVANEGVRATISKNEVMMFRQVYTPVSYNWISGCRIYRKDWTSEDLTMWVYMKYYDPGKDLDPIVYLVVCEFANEGTVEGMTAKVYTTSTKIAKQIIEAYR